MKKIKCGECNTIFSAENPLRLYCTLKCYRNHNRKAYIKRRAERENNKIRRSANMRKIKCRECNTVFSAENPLRLYCTLKCYQNHTQKAYLKRRSEREKEEENKK